MPIRIILDPHDEYAAAHIPDESGKVSWCQHVLVGRKRTDGRIWIIKDVSENELDTQVRIGKHPLYYTCTRCEASRKAVEKIPKPPPDIKEPDKRVEVLAHKDGRAHIFNPDNGTGGRHNARCGHYDHVRSTRWQRRESKMSDVTCRRCLRIVGQLVGQKKTKRDDGVDWNARLEAWEQG